MMFSNNILFSYDILSPYNRCSKKMAPVWRSDSYIFGSVVRDRPPIPPRQKMEAFDMLMIRWVYPPSKYPPRKWKLGFRSKNGVQKWTLGVHKKWNWGWMGSGWTQMGSYFGKMTPRGSGAFLNRIFGLPRPTNIKKVLKYAWTPLGLCLIGCQLGVPNQNDPWGRPWIHLGFGVLNLDFGSRVFIRGQHMVSQAREENTDK